MEYYVRIAIIVVLIIIILYMVSRPTYEGFSDGFTNALPPKVPELCTNPSYPEFIPGIGKTHPISDLVYDTIATRRNQVDPMDVGNLDPNTIAKLKDTILTDVSKTSKTQVAYNDIGAYRPGEIRPFNASNQLISLAQLENGNFLNDEYTDNYYDLWMVQRDAERDRVLRKANELRDSNLLCTNFDHVNQCMSVCTNTDHCMGFYIDSPGKCCMMVQPPYDDYRDRWTIPPNNTLPYAFRTLNNLINYEEIARDKVVFQKVKAEDGNSVYQVPMSREQCRNICPKCIMGRCPLNYRCVNMTADPRYNQSCIITNESRYDEKSGHTFDNSSIPYLDKVYALNEYAGYDAQLKKPELTFPKSQQFNVAEGIVPTGAELQKIFSNWDRNHVGPHTYRACTLDNMSLFKKPCTTQDMMQNYEEQCSADPKAKCHQQRKERLPTITQGTDRLHQSISSVKRGPEGFNPNIENFDAGSDCYNPEKKSDDANFVAIRGGNDPINLESYIDYTPRFIESEDIDWVTIKMVEKTVPSTSQRYIQYTKESKKN